jgi:hypothetical protein
LRESSAKVAHSATQRQHHSYVLNVVALGILFLLISSAVIAQGIAVDKTKQTDSSQDSVANAGPAFTVYSMRGICSNIGTAATSVTFDSSELPFEFTSLLFNTLQGGSVPGATYYAGSGMILNATGPNGNITMKEQSGKIIRTLQYQGQPSIVLNGEAAYTTTPKAYAEFEGTEILIQDWLKGTWSPEKGVVLERPTGMTIDTSEFYLMVFQPQAPVPEFGMFPLVALMVVVVCAAVSRMRSRDAT